MRTYLFFTLLSICNVLATAAQDSASTHRHTADSLYSVFNLPVPAFTKNAGDLKLDSLAKQKLASILTFDTAAFRKKLKFPAFPALTFNPKPLIAFNGGSISYAWNYRSAIDTPFQENSISQHLITGRMNVTLAQAIPVTVTYFERQSNSRYFRDYRDIRVELNTAEFQKLKAKRLSQYAEELTAQIRDPFTRPLLDMRTRQVGELGDWLNQKAVVNKLIASRVALLNGGIVDTATHVIDTALSSSRAFIAFYDEVKKRQQKLIAQKDSLQKEYVMREKQVIAIRKIISGNMSDEDKRSALQNILNHYHIEDDRLKKIFNTLSAVKTFAVGKVTPNYGDLSIKNINVNGVNFEYSRKIYFAFSAGAIDYRTRDFIYSNTRKKPQFVWVARIGYGERQGSHVYLTAFKGRKQLLSSAQNARSLEIYGLSLESQFVFHKNHRLLAEIAQSASPSLISTAGIAEKAPFKFDDEKNKAYSIKLNSYFPKTRSRIEAFYRYRGINFQSFSSYYTNAAVRSWHLKADQYMLKRMLRINLAFIQNNFENSLLPVRYSGNTLFKSVAVFFQKKNWPSLQLGYMPSSQLSEINGQVYENFYQTINMTISHSYKVGLARAVSIATYNRFYNDSKDSGFVYYNARNFYFNQVIQFLTHTVQVSVARSLSRYYTLSSLEAGADKSIGKQNALGVGIKLSELNRLVVKTGFYASCRLKIGWLGELNARLEKAYLPGWKDRLVSSEFYTIGFTRFFK